VKWLPNDHAEEPVAQRAKNYAGTTVPLYTRDRFGQYHLVPRPSLFQRAVSFFKSLSLSDFD
jgi:hypothetical protein